MEPVEKYRVWLETSPMFGMKQRVYVEMFGADRAAVERVARLTYRETFWLVERVADAAGQEADRG
jgi:hypothetical protein